MYSALVSVQKEFETYCLVNPIPTQRLEGSIFSADELLTIIKKSTLDNSWELAETLKTHTVFYKQAFHLDFDDSKVVEYIFTRKRKSREDIFLLGVVCFPSRLCYSYCETGRADSELSPDILNESEFKDALTNEFFG